MTSRIATLATALLMAGSSLAMAQTETPPTTPTPPGAPPAVTPAPPPTPAPKDPAPSARAPDGDATWYSHQPSDLRASRLIGTRVVNAANEAIGDIKEVVIDNEGKVAAVILGVGGFLGIGGREVGVRFQSINVARDANNNLVVTMNVNREALEAAPAWTWDQAMR